MIWPLPSLPVFTQWVDAGKVAKGTLHGRSAYESVGGVRITMVEPSRAIFSSAEYQRRLEKTRRTMENLGVELLLVSNPANMNYLTGYDGWSYYVHQMVVISLHQASPLWIGREMDVPGAVATSWLKSDSINGYADTFVDSSERHPMHFVSSLLVERGCEKGRIGVEMDSWYFTARAYRELLRSLPKAELVDAWPLVNWVRLVKSHQELDLMRGAGEIVSHAMGVAIDSIEPGVRENDAVADITHAQISGTPRFWGDYPATLAAVPSVTKSAAPDLTWNGDPFVSGSATNIELGGCHHRYHAALARTLYLGKPPLKLNQLAEATCEGMEAILSVLRAGRTCDDIESVWRHEMAKAGYEKNSRIGYSIGLNYPPDWGEQNASLRQGDNTVLGQNMCFHVMLGMWMEDWSFELSETVRITDAAPELLTSFPRKLFVKN